MILGSVCCMLSMLGAWKGVHTTQSLMIFSIIFGISSGMPLGLYAPYLGDLFGRANVGSLFGITSAGGGLIMGCGALLWGKIFEISGSYNLACLASAGSYAIATAALSFVYPPIKGHLKS